MRSLRGTSPAGGFYRVVSGWVYAPCNHTVLTSSGAMWAFQPHEGKLGWCPHSACNTYRTMHPRTLRGDAPAMPNPVIRCSSCYRDRSTERLINESGGLTACPGCGAKGTEFAAPGDVAVPVEDVPAAAPAVPVPAVVSRDARDALAEADLDREWGYGPDLDGPEEAPPDQPPEEIVELPDEEGPALTGVPDPNSPDDPDQQEELRRRARRALPFVDLTQEWDTSGLQVASIDDCPRCGRKHMVFKLTGQTDSRPASSSAAAAVIDEAGQSTTPASTVSTVN